MTRIFSPAHRAHLRAAMRRVWARRRAEPLPGRVHCPACGGVTESDPCGCCGAAVREPVAAAHQPRRSPTRAGAFQRRNHLRWHVARGVVNPDCPLCAGTIRMYSDN